METLALQASCQHTKRGTESRARLLGTGTSLLSWLRKVFPVLTELPLASVQPIEPSLSYDNPPWVEMGPETWSTLSNTLMFLVCSA